MVGFVVVVVVAGADRISLSPHVISLIVALVVAEGLTPRLGPW